MGNGCEVSGKSLSASAEGRLKWIRVMGAAVVLLLVAGLMLGSGSRRYAQKAMTPASGFPVQAILDKAQFKSNPVKSKPDARALLSQLPLIFEPNQGQTDAEREIRLAWSGLQSLSGFNRSGAGNADGATCTNESQRGVAKWE